jgi:hypothetical protein
VDREAASRRSERTLSLFATAVCGAPVTVVASERLVAPACASVARRTLWIDPERVGPYDLVLLAAMLRPRRGLRRFLPTDSPWGRRRVLRDTRAQVEREYASVRRLPGRWRDEVPDDELPELSADGPSMRGVEFGPGTSSVGATLVPGERIRGVEEDLGRLAAAVVAGHVPTRAHPGLPGLRYVEMPLRLRTHDLPLEETDAEREARRRADEGARGIVGCYENKTQGMQPTRVRPPRATGTRLDPRRLHEVATSLRTGTVARAFSRPPREVQTRFRPEQHYATLGFDAPSLVRAVGRRTSVNTNLLRVFVRCFELMEIDCVVVAFRDRVLPLPDGSSVYVHVPCVAKEADEPFAPAVWQRLEALWEPPAGGGEPACCVPLQLETLARHARDADALRSRRFLTLQYMTLSGLPASLDVAPRRAAAAAASDDVLRRLVEEVEGEWSVSLFVPQALIDEAPPGGHVTDASDLGL